MSPAHASHRFPCSAGRVPVWPTLGSPVTSQSQFRRFNILSCIHFFSSPDSPGRTFPYPHSQWGDFTRPRVTKSGLEALSLQSPASPTSPCCWTLTVKGLLWGRDRPSRRCAFIFRKPVSLCILLWDEISELRSLEAGGRGLGLQGGPQRQALHFLL